MHIRATSTILIMVFSYCPPKKRKENKNYLHGKAPNKQKKNGKYFWVFLFDYYSKEINYYYFFCFSSGLLNTQEESKKKKII